eukprot:TRINITY_DN8942_c0_g1_i1.p1 TRINITY_DN8942_c0_g1~~TRINITY_DN8942_c0_g1_i1.p1  ORF type:complete len:307 (+),score=52.13 TRINITY_DN8942_c0_g1_i1:1088-2008(+)
MWRIPPVKLKGIKGRHTHRGGGRSDFDWSDLMVVATASLILHGLVFFVVGLLPTDPPPYLEPKVIHTTEFVDEDVEEPLIDLEVEELDELLEVDIELEEPSLDQAFIEEEALLEIELEEEEDLDGADLSDLMEWTDFGDDFGVEETLALADMGAALGDGGLPEQYAGRTSEKSKRKSMRRFGGTDEALDSVEMALSWLAKTQASDGSWPFIAPPPKPEPKMDPKAEAAVKKAVEKHRADKAAKSKNKEKDKDDDKKKGKTQGDRGHHGFRHPGFSGRRLHGVQWQIQTSGAKGGDFPEPALERGPS